MPARERRRERTGHHLGAELQRIDDAEGETGILGGSLRDLFFRAETFGHQGFLVPGRREPFNDGGAARCRGRDATLTAEQRQQSGDRIADGSGLSAR